MLPLLQSKWCLVPEVTCRNAHAKQRNQSTSHCTCFIQHNKIILSDTNCTKTHLNRYKCIGPLNSIRFTFSLQVRTTTPSFAISCKHCHNMNILYISIHIAKVIIELSVYCSFTTLCSFTTVGLKAFDGLSLYWMANNYLQ